MAAWCGWVLIGLVTLAPLLAWLGPLGLAPALGLAGLLTLPAVRIEEDDRPAAIAVLVMVVWAAGSTIWSPYRPGELEEMTALKLIAMAALFWSAMSAAARAGPRAQRLALGLYAWGMAALGLVLLIEGLTGAALYQGLRTAIGDPIRADLAARNVTVGAFVLAVLWGPAAVAGARMGASWLALPMVAGIVSVSLASGTDAPLIALVLGLTGALAVWLWPRAGPRALATIAAVFFLLTPALLWQLRNQGAYGAVEEAAPLSWAQRMGYWRRALDWIFDHPLRGWGLDASRSFGPGIQLHPHDAALQLWLELGVIGAMAAAVFWVALFLRLGRSKPDAAAAASAVAAVSYLVFGAVSFGVWQEWWLATGALAAALCVVVARQPAAGQTRVDAALSARTSTIGPVSE